MLQSSCYILMNTTKSHAAAKHFCENQGVSFNTTGSLAKPFTYYHVSAKESSQKSLSRSKSSDQSVFFLRGFI